MQQDNLCAHSVMLKNTHIRRSVQSWLLQPIGRSPPNGILHCCSLVCCVILTKLACKCVAFMCLLRPLRTETLYKWRQTLLPWVARLASQTGSPSKVSHLFWRHDMTSQEERLSSKNMVHMYFTACNAISTVVRTMDHYSQDAQTVCRW